MEVERVLEFLRSTLAEAHNAKASKYRDGYLDALCETVEFIENELWDEGEEA